jgi:hypothetical protein
MKRDAIKLAQSVVRAKKADGGYLDDKSSSELYQLAQDMARTDEYGSHIMNARAADRAMREAKAAVAAPPAEPQREEARAPVQRYAEQPDVEEQPPLPPRVVRERAEEVAKSLREPEQPDTSLSGAWRPYNFPQTYRMPQSASAAPRLQTSFNNASLNPLSFRSMIKPAPFAERWFGYKSGGMVEKRMRKGYATRGEVEGEEPPKLDAEITEGLPPLTIRPQVREAGPGYDPMGNVTVPAEPQEVRREPQSQGEESFLQKMLRLNGEPSDSLRKAREALEQYSPFRAAEAIGRTYAKSAGETERENEELRQLAMRNMRGEFGPWMRPVGAGQMALNQIGTALFPLTAAAKTIGHGATELTGDPRFGGKVEFAAGFLDPSHIGAVKSAIPTAVAKAGQIARDIDPAAAMAFIPANPMDPALARAKQMLSEGKSKDEIWRETMMRPGPESHYPSSYLDETGNRVYREYVPEAEPRWYTEISDEGLKLKRAPHLDPNQIPGPESAKLKAWVADHPELEAQFPEMFELWQDIRTREKPALDLEGQFTSSAQMFPGKWVPKIEVRAPNPEEARVGMGHELTHYVADVGGLEQGNSPKNPLIAEFKDYELNRAQNSYNTIRAEIQSFIDDSYAAALQEFNVRPNTPQSLELYGKIREEAINIFNETEPQKMRELARSEYILDNIKTNTDMYQHLYGEAMANATEYRLDWPMEQRRANEPQFMIRTNDPNQPYRPVPEEYLYSEKDLYDFLRNKEKTQGVESFSVPPTAESVPPRAAIPEEVKAPAGNLNFRASEVSADLKGPEKQTVQSFLDQLSRRPGFTKDSVEELAAKFPDKDAVVSKADIESAMPKSEYSKVDLKQKELKNGEVNQHLMDQAHDLVMEAPDELYFDTLFDRYGINASLSEVKMVQNWEMGELPFGHLPTKIQEALRKETPPGMGMEDHFHITTQEVMTDRINATYQHLLEDEGFMTSGEGYKYQQYQRLLEDPVGMGEYFEFAVTNPNQTKIYRHYPNVEHAVAHVRGTFMPEGGEIISGQQSSPTKPHYFKENAYYNAKPNSMLIEEIQADIQKGAKQEGVTRHSHGVAFKAAIQHALEGGATTVYMPTSGPIAAVRNKKPEQFRSIYDDQIVKEGINPLKDIPGVTANKVADGAYWEIDFTPEAVQHILKGKGQRTPGFKRGGTVERAMELSRFGTDAVQSAVNKARQQRGRPANS